MATPSKTPQRKVVAATGGTAIGAVTANLVVGLVDDHIYVAGDVPAYLSAFILAIVPTALGFISGYLVKAEPRES